MRLLTGFEGRIGRRDWWTGVLAIICITLVIGVALRFVFADGTFGRMVGGLIGLALLYPWAAIITKRLHDHAMAPMPLLAVFLAPWIAQIAMSTFEIGLREGVRDIGGRTAVIMEPTPLGLVVRLAALGIAVWMIYLLGIKRGTEGENAHGPDPIDQA